MSTEAAKRFVPGAPPPPPVTKSQKKKRRTAKKEEDANSPEVSIPDTHAASLTEKAPAEQDVKSGAVAEELVVHAEPAKEEQQLEPGVAKPSPVVDLLNKRAKQLSKKITRIHAYSDKPASQLNDDQKKTLATLPSLEAIVKELDETKKAVETLEAENAKEAARQRAEAAEAEKQRIAEALTATQKAHAARTAKILDFIRLHSLLSNNDPSVLALNLVDEDVNAIFVAGSALLAHEAESKQDAVSGFLLGEGEVAGVSYLRLLEITENYVNPPAPEDVPAETEEVFEEPEASSEAEVEAVPVSEDAVEVHQTVIDGLPQSASFTAGTTGINFSFMQESELEHDAVSFENGAEWVEKEDVALSPEEPVPAAAPVEVIDTHQVPVPVEVAPIQVPDSAIDWADDEGGLPSIDGLHATFGTSGTATPAVNEPAPAAPTPTSAWSTTPSAATEPVAAKVNGIPNGHQSAPVADEDGFVPATRGTRGRGRARGGFRGNERGGFRGGDRGSFRGNFRGGRGKPFTGGENGGYRGSPDSEYRGRGRGRGRGYDRGTGVRGGAPKPAPNEA